MNNSHLWWSQIRCGSSLVENAVCELINENSFVIAHSNNIPWKSTFYAVLEEELSDINAMRSFEHIDFDPFKKPGRQILDSFCSARVISQYWLEESYGEYLAKADDTLLGQRFIVVSNICNENDLAAWIDFVKEYDDAVDKLKNKDNKAVFIIESSANVDYSGFKKINVIDYDQTEIDIYSFCVVNAAKTVTESYHLSRYLSELITIASDGYAEVAEKLLCRGSSLLNGFGIHVRDSYEETGLFFNKDINKVQFLAQLKCLFPLLEMHRRTIIEKYYDKIKLLLPWKDDYNNTKYDPFELELRDILFLSQRIGLTYDEKRTVDMLKEARNTLAHNKILSNSQVENICRLNK